MIPAILKVLHWLGPTGGTRVPRAISLREEEAAPGVRVRIHEPWGRPRGVYVVVPGMHPEGPDDPRLDRFSRALTACGFVVVAAFLPDHLALRVRPGACRDALSAYDHAARLASARGLPPPALFSISFGSLPAIHVAARTTPSALVLFGGYADFGASLRFALAGEPGRPHDPLNAPAIAMNLVDHLGVPDGEALCSAWLTLVRRTWGRPEPKVKGARDPIAAEVAATLPAALREPFLRGAGLAPGAMDDLETVLRDHRDALAFADPLPDLARVRCPIVVAHGREDDVIPVEEAEKLRAALPPGPHRVLVTGAYGHTGAASLSPRALAKEATAMLGIAHAVSSAPTGRLG